MRCKFLIPPVLMSRRFLYVLGIESSCDDAAVAIVNSEERRVLVDRRSADDESLLRLGGVLPYACARHHRSVIGPLIEKAFDDANLRSSDIDAVAVSTRPGIINCLKVGVEHALGFARCFHRPLVPVHHMRAHALVARLLHPHLSFPFLTLIASGAHCLICIVHGPNKFYVLADSGGGSPGECLDKLARELSLGPHKGSFASQMEQIAKKCPPDEVCRFALPSWSFGDEMDFNAIKCRYLQLIHRRKEMHKDGTELALWCAGIQHTVTELICQHLAPSLSFFASSNSPNKCILVLAGGVAANEYFRLRVKDIVIQRNFDEVIVLPQELCTDNGVMVAWSGAEILAHQRGERGTKRNEQMAPLFEETDQSEEPKGDTDQSEETKGEIDQSEDIVIHRPFPDSISVSARSQIGPFHDQFRQQKHLYS